MHSLAIRLQCIRLQHRNVHTVQHFHDIMNLLAYRCLRGLLKCMENRYT